MAVFTTESDLVILAAFTIESHFVIMVAFTTKSYCYIGGIEPDLVIWRH